MIEAGMCLHLPTDDNPTKHLWIVLTNPRKVSYPEPKGEMEVVALVNLTSNPTDKTTTLSVGDHPFIRKTTYVNYAFARILPVKTLELEIIRDPAVLDRTGCPAELLSVIRKVVEDPDANFVRPKIRQFCEGMW
jgi:hypothetical protein